MLIVEALAFVLEALLARKRMYDQQGEVLHANGAAILALPSQLDDSYRAVNADNFACWWRNWEAPLARLAAHAYDLRAHGEIRCYRSRVARLRPLYRFQVRRARPVGGKFVHHPPAGLTAL